MNKSNPLLSAHNIYKSYGDLNILKGPSFELKSSEIVAITGKSGAGKSTFLHVISTLEKMDRGSLHIDGEDVGRLKANALSEMRNEKIGFVFQFHHLINEFTALENVMVPLLIRGSSKANAKNRALESLSFVGLTDRVDHVPSKLSGGEQQRVAIARAIVHSPQIIFADEPTGNLDSMNASMVMDIFQKIRSELSSSFVIVTHDAKYALRCDRHFTMSDGKLET